MGGLLRVEITEALSRDDLLGLLRDLSEFERTLKRMPNRIMYLSDLVAADVDYRVMDAVATKRRQQVFPNGFRSAIVAPSEVSYGFARMFQMLNSNPQIEIRIFSDERAALAWVSESRDAGPVVRPDHS